jgi:hypothetical protein
MAPSYFDFLATKLPGGFRVKNALKKMEKREQARPMLDLLRGVR